MRIVTINVNGIRAAISKGLLEYLKQTGADIVCLQEIRAVEMQIPVIEFHGMGYDTCFFSAQKFGYSGTAIFSKISSDRYIKGMGIEKYDKEGRIIRMDIKEITYICVYYPSGTSGDERQAFKMQWLEDFHRYVNNLRLERPKLVISGDYNICHREIDIHDPVRNKNVSGFLPEEREWMDKFFNDGYIDTFRYLNTDLRQYTWWSFRGNARGKNMGWRLDYNVVTENLKNNIREAYIDDSVHFSDHCPVFLSLDI